MNIENIILYLIIILVIIVVSSFGFMLLKMYWNLRNNEDMLRKVRGNIITIAKLKKELRELKQGDYEAETTNHELGAMPDLSNLTLEQAVEYLGIDAKQLNNPIIRPLAEKIFNQLKERQQAGKENEQDLNTGY